jgi:uncharacterized HAD superfamily protein
MGRENTSWDYIKDHIDPAHNKWLWNEGVKKGLFRHGHLFPGTIKALNKLSEYGRLIAVTQRPHRAAQDTFEWIAYHRLPFSEVHVLQGEPKTSVGTFDAFIDDKPANCLELARAGTPIVCIPDRPWNQGGNGELIDAGVTRILTWDDFVTIIKDNYEAVSRS